MKMTFQERIETFPEPQRGQMLANTPSYMLSAGAAGLSDQNIVYQAFDWTDSPEGCNYWHDFAETRSIEAAQ